MGEECCFFGVGYLEDGVLGVSGGVVVVYGEVVFDVQCFVVFGVEEFYECLQFDGFVFDVYEDVVVVVEGVEWEV